MSIILTDEIQLFIVSLSVSIASRLVLNLRHFDSKIHQSLIGSTAISWNANSSEAVTPGQSSVGPRSLYRGMPLHDPVISASSGTESEGEGTPVKGPISGSGLCKDAVYSDARV